MSEIMKPVWPTELAKRYQDLGFWRGCELTACIRNHAQTAPDHIALVDSAGERFTYAEMDRMVDRVAAALRGWGLKPGDRMILQLPNVKELVMLLLGSIRAGVIPVMVLPTHREQEVVHLAKGSKAVAYAIADMEASFDFRQLARQVRQAAPDIVRTLVVGDTGGDAALISFKHFMEKAQNTAFTIQTDPASVALLLHSGGTGGMPKLIPRTHNDYEYNARASAEFCGFDNKTVYLASLSVAHNFPLACPGILGTFVMGGSVVLSRDPSPASVFSLIERHKVTVTAAVPTLATLWLEALEFDRPDLSSLRILQIGGAKLSPSVAARIHAAMPARVQQVFGMAEGLLNFTRLDDPTELVENSQGHPLSPQDEIIIVNEAGKPVALGEVGELWTRGPYTIRAYLASAEINARAFTEDGFYRTGDMVRCLPSGHLVVEGRAGDQINRGAEKFSASEIEDHLLDHPDIREIAVIGISDDDLGQASCAIVRPVNVAPTLRQLREFLRQRGLATYKLPDRIRVVDEIPLTRFGKIDRKKLLAQFNET